MSAPVRLSRIMFVEGAEPEHQLVAAVVAHAINDAFTGETPEVRREAREWAEKYGADLLGYFAPDSVPRDRLQELLIDMLRDAPTEDDRQTDPAEDLLHPPAPKDPDEVLSLREAERELGLAAGSLTKQIYAGVLPAQQDASRRWWVAREHVEWYRRNRRGRHGVKKLTTRDANRIRRLHAERVPIREIARRYQVTPPTIRQVVRTDGRAQDVAFRK